MNTETGGGSRSLKSLTSLISTTLVLLVLDVLAWVAAWLLKLDLVIVVAGALALATAVPLFLMFRRVKAVESDFGHREALSLAQRKETVQAFAEGARRARKPSATSRPSCGCSMNRRRWRTVTLRCRPR